jgi:hypothetical protein
MAAVLLCAASLGSAETAHPPGQYKDYGQGNLSCGRWLTDRRSDQATSLSDISWVLGWLSAAGYYDARGALRDTDANAVDAWVDKYCREHPLNDIQDAAVSLGDQLSKPK